MNDRNIYLQYFILLLEFWALARSFQGLGQLYQSLQLHSQSKNYHVLFFDLSKDRYRGRLFGNAFYIRIPPICTFSDRPPL